jgi:glycine cleavage system H protein
MSHIPAELKYTVEHEWISVVDSTTIRFGITDFAQAALGDIVFVTLPNVGKALAAGNPCGEVESTKSVSDIYAPVDGEVVAANSVVETNPETINTDPYGAGWIADVKVSDANAVMSQLLSADEYRGITTA